MKYLSKSYSPRIVAIIFLLFSLNICGFTQDIQLSVIAPPPHPSLLSEFEDVSGNYRVVITNTNPVASHIIYVTGKLTADNGIEAMLNDAYNGYEAIEIPAGSTTTYLFEELGGFLGNASLEDLDYSGGPAVEYLIQSQRLPDGVYQICLEARNFETQELVSLPMNVACSNPIIIQSINPPVITSPIDESIINQVNPTLINIFWTPVVAPAASIVYDFRLAEWNENINPYDAIENYNFIQYEETDIVGPNFIYNQSHTPLVEGRKYIVQVRARDITNSVNIFNEGWSDVIIFNFGTPINDGGEGDDLGQQGAYSCMEACPDIQIPDLPAIPEVRIGDLYKVGHFNLSIADFNITANGYTGRGVIKASDFIPRDINVQFQDVNINSRGVVTGGAIQGMRKVAAENFPRVDRISENTTVDEHLIDMLYDDLLDPTAAMISDDINDLINDIDIPLDLPISFGSGAQKVHIPDMSFSADGANISMISGYELEGDYIAGSQKMVFTNNNICITPGGLAMTDEVMKLDILQPYDFHPSEVFDLHINGKEGDNPSYIDFDCDGINEIVLNGHLHFNDQYIKPLDDDYTPVNNKDFAVAYSTSFTSWDEMIFTANASSLGRQGTNYFSSKFELTALPGFKFSLDDLVIDLSESENIANMRFPEDYGSPANWTGISINNIGLRLPDYFKNNNTPIDLSIDRFVIDENGASFNFRGRNLEDLTGISIGGWGISIDDLQLNLLRNDISGAALDGEIDLPICENPIGITCEIELVENRLNYDFDFDIREKIEVPMWASKFKFNEFSRIAAKIEDGEFVINSFLSGELELDGSIGDWDQVNIKKVRFEDMLVSNAAPYFRTGNIDIDAVVSASFMGFSIQVQDVSIEDVIKPGAVGKLPELGFNIGFQFGDKSGAGTGYFSADSRILLRGVRNRNTGSYSLDRTHLQTIEIDSDVAGVAIKGTLDFYDEHPVYGDGFGGAVDASFSEFGAIRARVLFGNTRDFDYWYVNAGVTLRNGVPIVPPIEILGVSGGAYYNMRQTIDRSAPIGEAQVDYVPRRNGWGFRLGTVWATSGNKDMLNGNADLMIDFGNGGRFSSVTLTGKAKMMSPPSKIENEVANTELALSGIIHYNHVEKTLAARFGYRLELPREYPMFTGGNLDANRPAIDLLIAGRDNWHLYVGQPSMDGSLERMVNISLRMPYKLKRSNKNIDTGTGIYAYFNIGSELPMNGNFPPAARRILDETRTRLIRLPRSGISMGLHAAFTTGDCKIGWEDVNVTFRASAGIGFDIAMAKYHNTLCNGDSEFGMDNWYFTSQAYLYAQASLRGKIWKSFSIADVSLGAMLKFDGPDPVYARGKFRVRIDVPIIPTFSINVGFSVGTKCEFSIDPNADIDFESEFEGIEVIEELSNLPVNDVNFTDRNQHIIASFFTRPNVINEETYQGRMFQYKVEPSYYISEEVDGNFVTRYPPNRIKTRPLNNGDVRFYFNSTKRSERMLKPGRTYRLTVKGVIKIREGNSGPFVIATYANGTQIRTIKNLEFTTESIEDYELEVLDINPLANAKNVHFGDMLFGIGNIDIAPESREMMDRLGYGEYATLYFKFSEYSRSNPLIKLREFTSEGFFSPSNNNRMHFNVAPLRTDRRYKMEILLQYEEEDPARMHWSYFETSKYRWYREKIESLNAEDMVAQSSGWSDDTYSVVFLGHEEFVDSEDALKITYLSQRTLGLTAWHHKRVAIEAFAQQHGFLHSVRMFTPEFVPADIVPADKNQGIGDIGVDLGAIIDGEPVLKYIWRPNLYISNLRSWAVNNHFASIYGNRELETLFFGAYTPITDQGDLRIKLSTVNNSITENFDFEF